MQTGCCFAPEIPRKDCQTLSFKLVCPAVTTTQMTRTSKCNERCGMDIFGFMGFYGPAWNLKQASDFLASKNRASIGGCAPSFCSSLMALAIL